MKGCLVLASLFILFVAGCLAFNIMADSGGDVQDSRADEMAELEELQNEEYSDIRRMDAVKDSYPGAIPYEEAPDHIGEDAAVYGIVAGVDQPDVDGDPIFVDLGVAYPDKRRTTGVIWSEYHDEFPDIFDCKDEIIIMRGTLYENDGVPNIKLTDASQIERVE